MPTSPAGRVEATLRRKHWPWALGIGAAVVAALVVAFTPPVLPTTAGVLMSLATGTHARFDGLRITPDRIVAGGIDVRSRAGPEIFRARRVEVRYDLGAWRRRRYGIVSVAVERPVVHLERLANGNWNIGQISGRGPAGKVRPSVPFWFSASLRDGRLELRDPARPSVGGRSLDLAHVNLTIRADDTETLSTFTARGELIDRGTAYPIVGAGSVSYARGDAIQRWRAARIPIADLADLFIASPAVRLSDGTARDLRATLFAVGLTRGSSPEYHLSGSAELTDGGLSLSVLTKPVTGIRGRALLFDSGFVAHTLQGEVGGTPIAIHGGIYGLTSGSPQLRLAIEGRGDLRDFRRLFRFSEQQPLEGRALVAVKLLGSTSDPLIITQLKAARARYASLPFRDIRGSIAYYRDTVTFDPLLGAYGPIDLQLGGTVTLGDHVRTDVEMTAEAPADRVPYMAQLASNPRILSAIRVGGTDLTFEGDAFVRGKGGNGSTFAAVSYDQNRLLMAPLHIVGPDGSALWSGAQIDQKTHRLAMWTTAADAIMRETTSPVALPGLDLPALPALYGRFSARVALEGRVADLAMSGTVSGRDLQLGPLAISRASGEIAGAGPNVAVFGATAQGPWGTAHLSGGYDPARDLLALRGPYRLDLAGARPLVADTPAQGTASGSLSVVVRPSRTLVQVEGRAVGRDTVRGVPVSSGFATVGIDDRGINVYAAGGQVGGGTAAAAGRYAPGAGLSVAARDVQVAQLRDTGVPLDRGRVFVLGRARPGQGGVLDFSGGLALVGSSLFGQGVSGSGRFDLAGDRVSVVRGTGAFGGAWASITGSIAGLGLGPPQFRLGVDVHALDVTPWAQRLGYGSLYPEGNVVASFQLTGTASDPRVDGAARMNVGAVHGMDFTDLSMRFDASKRAATLTDGSVVVGGSRVHFGAGLVNGLPRFSVVGHGIDLADFNDWFDEFDMLEGKGNVDLVATGIGANLSGHANVAIDGLRVRALPFGSLRADVRAQRSVADGTVHLGDATLGMLSVSGSAAFPHGSYDSLLAYGQHATAHVAARLSSFDLAKWLPALGIDAPLAGLADAIVTLDGRYPTARLVGTGQLRQGVIAKLPIDRLSMAVKSNFITTQITNADLELENVSATASGTIGPERHLALGVHLRSPNVRRLLYDMFKRSVDVDASGEADLHVAGTMEKPMLTGGFDLIGGSFGHLPFREAFGQLSLHGRDLELRNGELSLQQGTIGLAGRLPLQLSPLQLGPSNSPLGLNLSIDGVDLSDFRDFLPPQSKIGGKLDGTLALAGTLSDPLVAGQITVRGGNFVAPFERSPITNVDATVLLGGRNVTLQRLHGLVGGGSVDGKGSLTIMPGKGGATLAYRARLDAHNARIDVPQFGRGTLDARLALTSTGDKGPVLSGDVTMSNTSLSLSGLYAIATGGSPASALASSAPLGLGLDLRINAGRNVRVQDTVLDIGATGRMQIAGTMADPKLTASFQSTNGTISYFDRLFHVDRATLAFDPASGPIPYITATASTRITNVTPSVLVTLHATGPVTNLTVDFSSDQPYDRQQLLALLLDIPQLSRQGVVPGQPGANSATQLGGALPTLKGAPEIPTPTLPPGVLVPGQNGGLAVSAEALSILNAQFGRSLLAPLGGALGLQEFGLALEQGGAVAIDVGKALGERISVTYQQSFTIPIRQSAGFNYFPSDNTSINLRFFQQGASSLQSQLTNNATNTNLAPGEPLVGTQGWALSIRRLFP